jgi:hypothetical protein
MRISASFASECECKRERERENKNWGKRVSGGLKRMKRIKRTQMAPSRQISALVIHHVKFTFTSSFTRINSEDSDKTGHGCGRVSAKRCQTFIQTVIYE